MHSFHTTIPLQIVYLNTNNNLTKYLSVEGVSSYFTIRLNIQKLAKNIKFGSDIHTSDAKMDPFINFGPDIFAYLKNIGVPIKEKITDTIAIGFALFGHNTGPKSQFVNLALCCVMRKHEFEFPSGLTQTRLYSNCRLLVA